MLTTRKTDAKGRLTLGAAYANATILIESQRSGSMLIKKATVVPERKMQLLYKATLLKKTEQRQKAIEDIKKLRGFLTGIDTFVPRDKDRV